MSLRFSGGCSSPRSWRHAVSSLFLSKTSSTSLANKRQIHDVRAQNEVLLARISALSSRAELQRKLNQGLIALQPIQDHYIARIGQPVTADKGGGMRTAANERFRP